MVAHVLTPVQVQASLTMNAQATVTPPFLSEIPGSLHPLRLAIYDVPEYRMRNGFPTDKPPLDIHADSLFSVTGEVMADRLAPTQINTGAETRWVVDEELFSEDMLSWTPWQDQIPVVLRSSVEYMPTLTPYEYRIGKEVFLGEAINFDADSRQHMWLDTQGIMPLSGYTVIMVVSLNSAYGNTNEIPYSGIWCHGNPTPAGDSFAEPGDAWFDLDMMGNYLYLSTEQRDRRQTVSVSERLTSTAPMYIALAAGHPVATVYVATGPGLVRSLTVPTGALLPDALHPGVVLGRSNGDVLHTADMALFDLGIYGRVLSESEVLAEIALLSQVYGGE